MTTIDVWLRDGDDATLETCEYCGVDVVAAWIDWHDGNGPQGSWWEPITVGGQGPHTPDRCRSLRARGTG